MPNGKDKQLNFTLKVWDAAAGAYRPVYIAPDATDKVQGDVKLSDATNSTANAASGMTAATPAAVKAVADTINALDVTDTAVANKYVSQVTETNGKITVTRAALPVVSVTSGATNGTVAVNGTDVKVHGLGSAAYTNTDAYDAAGTASAAVAALDVADKAVAGQYVSAVSETDGKITVTRTALPAAPKITTGTANGTIAVDETNVAVKGLGSAAYTASTAYATAAQGALADSAVQSITEGTTPGAILVDSTSIPVHGLGSAAYTQSSAYATAAQGTKADQIFNALTWQEA